MKNKLLTFVFTLSTLSLHAYDININGFVTTSKGLELHYTNLEEI